jgi:hypothetical protein
MAEIEGERGAVIEHKYVWSMLEFGPKTLLGFG